MLKSNATITSTNRVIIYHDVNLYYGSDTNAIDVFNVTAVNNKIWNVLNTIKGERFNEPEFGSRINYLLFEPLDDITAWRIETEVFDALQQWLSDEIEINFGQTRVYADYTTGSFIGQVVYKILENGRTIPLSLQFVRDSVRRQSQ